ncbi:Transposon Tf2-11 polyprotein [Labeo rohita]|uniref:Transposon Tf2-11 polyprotein n=1 Tax=Labeo rohita TaxID=84645 RepID=A0ABQ8KZK7_LABRO|nr:Transposon Tf2-11 polyprotein [Labeo rohita]
MEADAISAVEDGRCSPKCKATVREHEKVRVTSGDRKCPKFSGWSGIGINEWAEEALDGMRLWHLSTADQAFFLVDHLEGEAREEICYQSVNKREDPKQMIKVLCIHYGVQRHEHINSSSGSAVTEISELWDMLRKQQQQLKGFSNLAILLEIVMGNGDPSDHHQPVLLYPIGGVQVPCLVDTGSMVSTITESSFVTNFGSWGQEQLRSCHWLQLRAANGLSIPYIGYLELDVELCGQVVLGCGVLVVRDPPGGVCARVPGVLGMNILSCCYRELFGQHVLYASTVISTVNQVDVVGLPPEVAEIVTVTAKMSTQVVQVSPSVQEQIEEEQGKRFRRVPPSEYEVVKVHINQLLETQVIRECYSPNALPIVLVKRKDGSLHMCVDYHCLNAKTRKDSFPLPHIEETLDSLAG